MSQKIEDIKMMFQTDRRIWAGAGAIMLFILIWAMSNTERRRTPKGTGNIETVDASNPGNGATEAYNDLTVAFREDLETVTRASAENQAVIKKMSREMSEYKERTTSIFQTLVDRMEELNREVDRLAEVTATAGAQANIALEAGGVGDDQAAIVEQDDIEPMGFDKTDVPVPPPAPPEERMSVISPGDVVPLKLLTGVNAPVDGTPYPVVFKIVGPINGPDGSSLDVGEARLIAAAQGSEADGRVLFRLTNLAMRHKDGRRSVVNVDGWIVGEDGVRGMRGKLIDKLGRLIATTAGVSFAAALGETLTDNASNGTSTIVTEGGVYDLSGNDVDAATASALTDASNRLGEILLERYEKLVPVVEVLSGREVMAVFSSTAEVELYNPDDEGIYASTLD
ncbi:MAG: hypothetical protein KDD66_04735 [Bdellovibrionales bacterium]|nr:hypothetical protein [Bdellovibrionales bacterium]